MSNPSIPVGSIVPYCGPLETVDQKTNLQKTGWLLCDGTAYPKTFYPELASAIGTAFGGTAGKDGVFNVPDLRGRFLRGLSGNSGRDPDAAARIAILSGGNPGNAVGSLQEPATALPTNAFQSESSGLHNHNVLNGPASNNAYAVSGSSYAIWNPNSSSTDLAGNHSHNLVSGWDAESRPINVYVYFIIKSRDHNSSS